MGRRSSALRRGLGIPSPYRVHGVKSSSTESENKVSDMEFYQLKDLLFISLSGLVVLIPVVGLTARFTLGPLIEKYAKMRSGEVDNLSLQVGKLREEVGRLKDYTAELETQVVRLEDTAEFDRQLRPGMQERGA